ncbi:MAG: hypothetical protein JWQ59_2474 [Cryobacterium sp.]|nr:hypothetical protein [Cryobacterium sp.]
MHAKQRVPAAVPRRSAAPRASAERKPTSVSLGQRTPALRSESARCACGGGCPACRAATTNLAIAHPATGPKAIWTKQLSQPSEAAERQADARAASALRGPPLPTAQPSSRGGLPGGVPAAIADRAAAGRPLDASAAADLGARFGTRFDHVKVHDDAHAAGLADAADARAFTIGSHVFFNRGEYRPRSPVGRALLAHELAHVEQGHGGQARLWRKGKGEVVMGEPIVNGPESQQETWEKMQVIASGMDDAALVLGGSKLSFTGQGGRNLVFVGLHPKFVKVYDKDGKALGPRVPLKEVKGLTFDPGVYVQGPKGMVALTISSDGKKLDTEGTQSVIGHREFTDEEKTAIAKEAKIAEREARPAKERRPAVLDFAAILTDEGRFKAMVASVSDPLVIYFAPSYAGGAGGKAGGESKGLYASPIESRGDGQPANAPQWPVSVDGPKLVPVNADPTYVSRIDWGANGNYSVSSQAISQIGESIHYRWERFDITQYARKKLAQDHARAKADSTATPEKTLDQRIADYTASKAGSGTDVTGTGGARHEFRREFDDWWKDTKRANSATSNPNGDTVSERLSSAMANDLTLELAPVSLLVTALGATMRLIADLFAGPRVQQEIPLENEGIFLIRVISTPSINEDTQGQPIIRPPSVASKVTEVTPMARAVSEALDEPAAKLAELQTRIDIAVAAGNASKAEYLQMLLDGERFQTEASPAELLLRKRDEKQKELEEFRKTYPTLSDYSRAREVSMLNDQIALDARHHRGLGSGGYLRRLNATLISEVTGAQYPLLVSAGPVTTAGSEHRWMVSDVTNRDGDAFAGEGDRPSTALLAALKQFGGKAAYGRGHIGVRTAGLGLEDGAPTQLDADSLPTDWALAERRIDDLVMTLAALGLIVASAGTAGALVGAAVAAARLIQRWQAGKLYLDEQTVSDVLGLLGGLGAAGSLVAGLRVQKFEKVFTIVEEGRNTEAQFAAAAEALKGAQQLAHGVELANEALGYAGVLWGNIAFADQMMSISEQESSGALTHAAARRARAGAISSAVQNNGLFIAGNVLKARQVRKASVEETKPPEKQATEAKSIEEGVLAEDGSHPAQKVGEPPPIGERQATLAELKASLSPDLREMLVVDTTLEGDRVQAEYDVDPDNGLITEIKLRCSPDARPSTVALHEATVRTMQKYQGFGGRVRIALNWVTEVLGFSPNTPNPEHRTSFEAALEVQKLPALIRDQLQSMKKMSPDAVRLAEAELAGMETQLEDNLRKLNFGAEGEGEGFVAKKAMSKAKQKQWAALQEKLWTLEKGSDDHRDTRWEMYQLESGDLPYERWEKTYQANLERANKGNAIEASEIKRVGWGRRTSITVDGQTRVLDIAAGMKAIEVKAYTSGKVSATEHNVSELQFDAKLVVNGWDITWLFIDCEPTGPLKDQLLAGRITIEIRKRAGLTVEQVTIIKPPAKPKS